MKAALCRSLDGPKSIEITDLPRPEPELGGVVVEVEAVALNFMDTLITRGRYQIKPELPFSPGAEIAGVVTDVGCDVDGFKPGDRVCAYVGHGGARAAVAVPASRLVTVPAEVPLEVAAGLNVAYGTAMYALIDRIASCAGRNVAVLGAAGGAGLAAVEVAKQLGATVVAVASSDEKLAIAKNHGADQVVKSDGGDLKDALRAATGGVGPDVVYDCVGGDCSEPALRSLASGGDFIVIGFAAGEIPKLPANIVLLKNCNVVGIHWSVAVEKAPDLQRSNMERLMTWIAEAKISPRLHAVRPLEEIVAALDDLATRKATGKIILRP